MVSNSDLEKWQTATNGINESGQKDLTGEEWSALVTLNGSLQNGNFESDESRNALTLLKNNLRRHDNNQILQMHLQSFIALCEQYFPNKNEMVQQQVPPPPSSFKMNSQSQPATYGGIPNEDIANWQKAVQGIESGQNNLSSEELSAFNLLKRLVDIGNFRSIESGVNIRILKDALPRHSTHRLLQIHLKNFISLCEKYFQTNEQTISLKTRQSSVTTKDTNKTKGGVNKTLILIIAVMVAGFFVYTYWNSIKDVIGIKSPEPDSTRTIGLSNESNQIMFNRNQIFSNDIMAAENFESGDGTQNTPYLIYNSRQLKKLVNDVSNGNGYANTYFKLMTDIQVTTDEWIPIGSNSSPFHGNFNGAGCKIVGLRINNSSGDVGLFGFIEGGTVRNLGVVNANIKGNAGVGGVAGLICNGSIINCYVTGMFNGTAVGGVAGNVNNSVIINCYSTGSVSGTSMQGGIGGSIYLGSKVTNCYTTDTVRGIGGSIGGIAGMVRDNGRVINCVALNPSVNGSNSPIGIGRVAGYIFMGGSLLNNWANCNMTVTVNSTSKTFVKGKSEMDGEDCATIPVVSWWTTAFPNGPGWSSTIWYFANGLLPTIPKAILSDNTNESSVKNEQNQPIEQTHVNTTIYSSANNLSSALSTRLLAEDDLRGMSKPELRILRNEIYARHGYIFKSQDLRDYFSAKDWYHPQYNDVSSLLNTIEKKNVAFIQRHE